MKYGKEITKEICDYIRNGSNRTDAVTLSGITYETFTQWMKKPDFSEPIKKAEATCKQRNIQLIQRAALTTWTAAAWWLERKYPKEFATRQRLEHSGPEGGAIKTVTVDLGKVDDKVLMKLVNGSEQNTNGLK